MTETAFTARDAAEALAEAATYEDALRRRTEGLTWMVWGLVSPAIFLTYALVAVTSDSALGNMGSFLWAPWVAAGVLTTAALWRSASLAAPRMERTSPRWYVFLTLYLVVYFMSATGAVFLMPRLNEPTFALLIMGGAWTGMSAVNVFRNGRSGRLTGLAIGAVILVVALILAATLPADRDTGYAVATWTAVVASGAAPLLGGFWHTMRG